MRGGSIIASNILIFAAQCFWKKCMLSNNISIIDYLYKVPDGKYRNFTIINVYEITQIMNVDVIHLKEDYYGCFGFHAVCIDWNGNYNVANGNKAKFQNMTWMRKTAVQAYAFYTLIFII